MEIKIAVDGPSGVGKSSVCRQLANELEFIYINSGLYYRLYAYLLSIEKFLSDDPSVRSYLAHQLNKPEFSAWLWSEHRIEVLSCGIILVDDKDVTIDLASPEHAHTASTIVAPQHVVRDFITQKIQRIIGRNSCVVEGRDAATRIIPDANIKVYLDASIQTRATRRYLQLTNNGIKADVEELIDQMRMRDEQDAMRGADPLVVAQDSIVIDTTHMQLHEVIETIKRLISNLEH